MESLPAANRRPPEGSSNLIHLRVVLVRPRNPLNIGAAARAMANFGFTDLAVVKPFAPVWRETTSAVGAEKLVLEARVFSDVEEAIGDRHLVVGTTALRNRALERPAVSLPDLMGYLAKNHPAYSEEGGYKIALLFGPEKTGLSGACLERCHFWLTIPTDPGCPSMNLGQSVALCCYEWAKILGAAGGGAFPGTVGEPETATMADRRRLVEKTMEVFEAANYLKFIPRAAQERKLRRLFQRWNIRRQDVQLMHGAFRFILNAVRKGAGLEK